MPRLYRKKTNRPPVDEKIMIKAVTEVIKCKKSYRVTANKYNLKLPTLYKRVQIALQFSKKTPKNHIDSGNDSSDEDAQFKTSHVVGRSTFKNRQVFTNENEMDLQNYLIETSRICYGLTYKQTRELAYEYAKYLNINYPASWNRNKIAGKDWMKNFMDRHPNLRLRKPENTSIARASAFNKNNVDDFFKNYHIVLDKWKFTAPKIWNIDETGITTVLPSPKVKIGLDFRCISTIID